MNLSGKTAIVTGSSRGFGAAIAETLGKYGATPVVTYLHGDATEQQNAEQVAARVGTDVTFALDVRDRSCVRDVMQRVFDRYGRIDVLVNNAGINIVGDFDEITDQDWQAVIDVDLKGVFTCCQEVLPFISDSGRVINIGSVSGQYGGPRTPSYAAAKAGVMALTHCLARFAGHRNITVNCVSPGTIQSDMLASTMPASLRDTVLPMVLLKRLGTIDEVAETVAFLASDGAGYITGQTIAVNGGIWV